MEINIDTMVGCYSPDDRPDDPRECNLWARRGLDAMQAVYASLTEATDEDARKVTESIKALSGLIYRSYEEVQDDVSFAVDELKNLKGCDPEISHEYADGLLMELLGRFLPMAVFEELKEAYRGVPKWYS